MLFHCFSDGVSGTLLLRPSLGASTRFASTTAKASAPDGTNEPSSAVQGTAVVPSAVLFKVGSDIHTTWRSFKHDKLLGMDASDLLEALADSKMFALALKDVKLSACSIAVVKNAVLPAGVTVPPVALEAGDAVVEMEGAQTVGDMAKEVGVSGAPLFIRVGLPTAAAVLPIFPPLPVPIVFKPIVLDGQDWFVTRLAQQDGVSVPMFLTAAQHGELVRFIRERPKKQPQALMPVGTIKSGKSTILRKLLPGMI